jgi:hypothetical protein
MEGVPRLERAPGVGLRVVAASAAAELPASAAAELPAPELPRP